MKKYENKKVTVLGLSERTGIAVTEKLIEIKAQVMVSDIKKSDQLKPQLAILKKHDNIKYDLGGHSEKILDSDLIVLSPGVPPNLDILCRAEKLGIEIISEIELAYRLTDANIIGITGTNGKTTVTSLAGHLLKENLDNKVRVAGNIGSPLIAEINGMEKNDWLVAELSSFQLEKIKYFKPEISVFINFAPDHLDRHITGQNYWKAKKRIFENQSKKDKAIINIDDNFLREKIADIKAELYKVTNKYEIDRGVYFDQEKISLFKEGKQEPIIETKDIPLVGTHNILNTAFAVLLAKIFNIKNDNIRQAVISYQAFAHRLEIIYDQEYRIIDDSKATNPHAAVNALRSLDAPIILIVGGQDRQADFSNLAYTIRERVHKVIIMGETKYKIKHALQQVGCNNFEIVKNMQAAVRSSLIDIKKGYTVLLSPACPSWDMYESYKKRGKDFQKEVKRYL
ncbi:MAG: UDP-N-acetylmuramoyl-L-alanine--D-glutamate ligase [Halanaerobiales bacterium]|nr:UDP-N-acetylmuramoyl-L-alanine--D-glutamate ligase [Halanaerobiales bacterium]